MKEINSYTTILYLYMTYYYYMCEKCFEEYGEVLPNDEYRNSEYEVSASANKTCDCGFSPQCNEDIEPYLKLDEDINAISNN